MPTTEASLDAGEVVAHLRATYRSGRTRSLAWREEQLSALAAMLTDGSDELVAALAHDLGRPELEGWSADVRLTVREVDDIRRRFRTWAADQRFRTPAFFRPGRTWTRFEPLGVVLVMAPWNYPVQLLVLPLAAAVAAGNAVLAKPSEVAPATSATLARLAAEHLDTDAIRFVEGGIEESRALLAQRFDHIMFTGNGTVGRVVAEAAAQHLTPVTLELGGKSPVIVDRDANLGVAASRVAAARWWNAGQTCIAADHVYVHEDVEEEFVDRLRRQVRKRYGSDPRSSPDYGRIVDERHTQRVAALIAGGGYDEVACGGEVDVADRYVAPTVLRGVKPDAPVMQEEIFGPVLPVIAYADLADPIARINEGDNPLALYVFTRSEETVERVLAETSSGGVSINDTLNHVANTALPFGGVGASGYGAYHGRWGFETFSHRKAVYRRPYRFPDVALLRPPYKRWKLRLLRKVY
jgi:aldehyde dehydrogenase (NAD+)